jgi:hypothetical protein
VSVVGKWRGRLGRLRGSVRRFRDDYRLPGLVARDTATHDAWTARHVASTMHWVSLVPLAVGETVSVVMATRDRAAMLPDAVASVLAQTYPALELVVVDDGSTDSTPSFLAGLADPRVRVVRTSGLGLAGARNAGLSVATGTLVAYLDDDNLMHPDWLRAVVWAFRRWPATRWLYGARVVEDMLSIHGRVDTDEWPPPVGAFPLLEFKSFDLDLLRRANYLDINTIAHRADLPSARFDTTTHAASDWDLILRFSAIAPPLPLPAVSCGYSTRHAGRLLSEPDFAEDIDRVLRLQAEREGG